MGSFGERGRACPELTGGGVAAWVLRGPRRPLTVNGANVRAMLARGLHTARWHEGATWTHAEAQWVVHAWSR